MIRYEKESPTNHFDQPKGASTFAAPYLHESQGSFIHLFLIFFLFPFLKQISDLRIFRFGINCRPLSRRLDRCDRVIQDEIGDSNGGNM